MKMYVATVMVSPFITRLKWCIKSTCTLSPPAPSGSRHSSGDVCMIQYFTVFDRTVYRRYDLHTQLEVGSLAGP